MAGASQYPPQVDTDVVLVRVIAADPVIVAHHNNLVDAIESIEGAIGPLDNTLHGAIAAGAYAPIVDQLGLLSVAGRNPMRPYGSLASTDFYAVQAALPVGATLDGGLTVNLVVDAPYARFTFDSDSALRVLHLPLAAGPATGVIARFKFRQVNGTSPQVAIGFITTVGAVFEGIGVSGPSQLSFLDGGTVTAMLLDAGAYWDASDWLWLQVFYSGTAYVCRISTDGVLWNTVVSIPSTDAPASAAMSFLASAATPFDVWVSHIVQGTLNIGA